MNSYKAIVTTEKGDFLLGRVNWCPRGWRFVSWTSGYANSRKLFDTPEETIKRFKGNVRLEA
jgi:hypothetical protein